jgi:hypothetical protein
MSVPRVENCIYSGAMKFQSIIIVFARILVMKIISGYSEERTLRRSTAKFSKKIKVLQIG